MGRDWYEKSLNVSHKSKENIVDITLQGLDFDKLASKKRFAFVDGLSGLFVPRQANVGKRTGETVMSNPSLASLAQEIQHVIQDLQGSQGGGKVFLVVDQLDFLLAAGGEKIGATEVEDMLMGLREVCHVVRPSRDVVDVEFRTFMPRSCLSQQINL